jgi:ADP-ribose pyrophosphatase
VNHGDGSETLYAGRFVHLKRRQRWEYAERVGVPGIALIIAVTDAGELVLNEQYRIPVQRRVIELPAGLVGDQPESAGEALAEGARRELLEETGFAATTMTMLSAGPPSAGITNEILTLFQASGLRRVAAGGGVDGEGITAHLVPLPQVRDWLREREAEGCLVDPKVFIGLYFAGAAPV